MTLKINTPKVIRFKGSASLPYIQHLAELRIKLFREYPYLYEGDLEYETHYLQTYIESPESIAVIAFDGDIVVGVSTAIPLEFEMAECKQPFLDQGLNVKEIFYFGESLLLPQYRGRGVYRYFFQEREAAAREYGAKIAAFCAVARDEHDQRKPQGYQPLNKVWQRFGYQQRPDIHTFFEWKELGEQQPTPKPMIFWIKNL